MVNQFHLWKRRVDWSKVTLLMPARRGYATWQSAAWKNPAMHSPCRVMGHGDTSALLYEEEHANVSKGTWSGQQAAQNNLIAR